MNVCLFLFLTCTWGGAYLGIHYGIAVYPPFFAAALRVLCSTALMLPFAWVALRQVPAWPVLVGAVIIFSGVYRVKRVTGA